MNSTNKQESVALIFINDKPTCMTMPEFKQWFKSQVDKIKQDKEQNEKFRHVSNAMPAARARWDAFMENGLDADGVTR